MRDVETQTTAIRVNHGRPKIHSIRQNTNERTMTNQINSDTDSEDRQNEFDHFCQATSLHGWRFLSSEERSSHREASINYVDKLGRQCLSNINDTKV